MVSLVLALEQTVGAPTGSASWATWLPWVAAFGTLISLTILTLTVVFRIRDSRTRATIRVEVVRRGVESRGTSKAIFQVVCKSKIPLHLDHQGYLGTAVERRAICIIKALGADAIVQQGSLRNYVDELAYVRMMLHKAGYKDKDTASVYFVVQDANGKVHEQPILVQGLKRPDTTTLTKLPFPWYKRWARSVLRWRQARRGQSG